MAPLPPSNTARGFIDYTVAGQARSLQLRGFNSDAVAGIVATFRTLLLAHQASFYNNVVFTGARAAAAGTNVTNPLPWTSLTGTHTQSLPLRGTPQFISHQGRSPDGRRVDFELYGFNAGVDTPDDYRFTGEESPAVSAFRSDFLDFIEETGVRTISNQPPVMKTYTNFGVNAYHQRKLRG